MANNQQTFYGNITADPELRYTQSGVPVVSFTVAQSVGRFDRDKGEYVEQGTVFLRVSAWRGLAENIAASFHKGQRVIVTGVLKQSSYEDKDGNRRTSIELDADDAAPSLLYGKADFVKVARDRPGHAQGQAGPAATVKPEAATSPAAAVAPAPDDDDDDYL